MNKDLTALILTGGLGTRLRPLTLYSPKPLLPIGNLPFLSYPLALLRTHGVREAALCIADSPEPYQKFIREQKKLGSKVFCSQETKALGTAGALKNAEKFIHSSPFFILNGDVLTDINLSELFHFHKKRGALITIALIQVPDPQNYGLVITENSGKVKKFLEKPSLDQLQDENEFYINAGIYLFEKELFNLIPPNKIYSTERELFPDCLNRNLPCYGYKVAHTSHWIDIGTPEKYLEANQFVTSASGAWDGSKPLRLGLKSKIHPTSAIGKDVIMGHRVKIGEQCMIKNSVIGDGVVIENHCVIENCIIGNCAKIEHSSIIKNVKVIGNYSKITAYSKL